MKMTWKNIKCKVAQKMKMGPVGGGQLGRDAKGKGPSRLKLIRKTGRRLAAATYYPNLITGTIPSSSIDFPDIGDQADLDASCEYLALIRRGFRDVSPYTNYGRDLGSGAGMG